MVNFNLGEEFEGKLPEAYDKYSGRRLTELGLVKEQTLKVYYVENRGEFLGVVDRYRGQGAILDMYNDNMGIIAFHGRGGSMVAELESGREQFSFEYERDNESRVYPCIIEIREDTRPNKDTITMEFISYEEMVHRYEVPDIETLDYKLQRDFNTSVIYGSTLESTSEGIRGFKGFYTDDYKKDYLEATDEAMNSYLQGTITKEEAFELLKESYMKNSDLV